MSKHTATVEGPALAAPPREPKGRHAPAPAPGPPKPNGKTVSEEEVRLCAYCKWEAAGHPDGDGVNFWLEAEKELRQDR
jgi:hypothetical protein